MSIIEHNPATAPPADDPFRYGWKEELITLPDGTTKLKCLPLTLEEVLHPEENYKIMNGSRHAEECAYLKYVIGHRVRHDPHAVVLSDTGVYWEDRILDHHSPDLSLILNVREIRDNWPSFYVAEHGVRPVLIIEITSPNHRENDVVKKVKHYHQAGVPWYIIADRIQNEGPPTLIGLRWTPEGYVEFPPDEEGRLLLEPINLKLGVHETRVALFDAETGAMLGDYDAIASALQAAEEKARAEELARQAAEEQTRREAEARHTAEAQTQRETEARHTAEAQTQRETEARRTAEAQTQRETEARRTAEAQTQRETEARHTAEEQTRREAEARHTAEEQRRLEAEARHTAEEQTRREAEARQAAERRAQAEADSRQAAESRLAALLEQLHQLQQRPAANPPITP